MAADWLLLPVLGEEGPLLFAVSGGAQGLARHPRASHDATRPVAEVRLQGVLVPDAACLARGAAAEHALESGRQIGAIVLASEQVGVAQQCLDLTVAYLGQRVQFGKPLASFQALKHRCAQMMVAVELARSAVIGAAQECDGPSGQGRRLRLAAMARCLADDAAQYCTQEAIQLHGGVGFTWEYDPHLFNGLAELGDKRGFESGLKAATDRSLPFIVRTAALGVVGAAGKGDPRAFPLIFDKFKAAFATGNIQGIVNGIQAIVKLADPRGQEAIDMLKTKFKDNPGAMQCVSAQEALVKASVKP